MPAVTPDHTPRPSLNPTVVFDLDGTLVDTIELIVASYQHAFRTILGEERPEAEIRGWIGQPLIRAFRTGWPDKADALFAEYVVWNRANTARLIRAYDGVNDVLVDLAAAGVRVGVATSKLREAATLCADLVGISPYADTLVCLEDTEEHKPNPAPLLLAVERLGGAPNEATYVGDAVVDVLAAQAAGMTAVAVTWGAGLRDELVAAGPAAVCDTAADLRAALLG